MSGNNKSNNQKSRAVTRTQKWKRTFIKVLGETGNVSVAIEAARVARPTAYEHKQNDQVFAAEWADALERAADVLEGEARRRAFEGVEEPVFGSLGQGRGGGEIGRVRKYSDVLLMFLLKGLRPQKFRDYYHLTQNKALTAALKDC
jgi:hypothetical protein